MVACRTIFISLASVLVARAVDIDNPDACFAGSGRCAAASIAGENDAALAMLQHGARADGKLAAGQEAKMAADASHGSKKQARIAEGASRKAQGHRYFPNSTAVWDQIKGAVEIDEWRKQIQEATDSDTIKNLQSQISELEKRFPSADEVQKEFSDQWESLTQAVDVDNLQKKLEEAKAAGSEHVEEIQKQLNELYAQMPSVNLDYLQNKTANMWAQMQESGLPLPELDDVSDLANQAYDTANDLASQASDAVSGAVSNISGIMNSWWR